MRHCCATSAHGAPRQSVYVQLTQFGQYSRCRSATLFRATGTAPCAVCSGDRQGSQRGVDQSHVLSCSQSHLVDGSGPLPTNGPDLRVGSFSGHRTSCRPATGRGCICSSVDSISITQRAHQCMGLQGAAVLLPCYDVCLEPVCRGARNSIAPTCTDACIHLVCNSHPGASRGQFC